VSTPLTSFIEPVRVIIGDNDPDIQIRENSQILAAIKTVIDLGKVSGVQATGYSLTTDRAGITPDLLAVEDPKALAQLVYSTAQLFAVDVAPTAWRTRAFSESIGANPERIMHILDELYRATNGDGCSSLDYPES